MSGTSNSNVNVINSIAVVVVLLLVGVLLVAALTPRRGHGPGSRRTKNTTQVRGIVQGLVTYGAGNKGYYPGLNSKGEVIDVSVEHRFWVLLDNNSFTGTYAISPSETKTPWTTGPVSRANYSYSMLQVQGDVGKKLDVGRGDEWRQTINPQAVVLSDRNTGTDASANIQSIHTSSPGLMAWGSRSQRW